MRFYRYYVEEIVSHDDALHKYYSLFMYQLPLTRGVLIPYTRYSEIAEAISTICMRLAGKVILLGKK